ncbi:MAG: hypothetical protein JXA95_06415 [Spirochaetales bacterium]|nr:hypothetical protein [Spirochaetales bacterium]
MASKQRKAILGLPLKLIFNETGVSFFINNNKKLNRFTTADGAERYGVMLKQFSPASLQHMMMIGYIARIEVSRSDFSSCRSDLMDLSKLVTYGYLYKSFNEEVSRVIMESETIKSWNRNNPGNSIDNKTRVNEAATKAILENSKSVIEETKKAILKGVIRRISQNESLQADEKNIHIFLSEKFLDNLPPLIWFILVKFASSFEWDTVYMDMQNSLEKYLSKSRIAEYLALMHMELCLSAESRNMKNYVEEKYKGAVSYESLVYDPEKREKLVHAMEEQGELISTAWKIGSRTDSSIGTEKKLEVLVYNKGAETLALRDKINKKLHSSVKDTSLGEFYQASDNPTSEMGLNYLSYLVEECEEAGIRFSSRVNDMGEGRNFLVLTLQFS